MGAGGVAVFMLEIIKLHLDAVSFQPFTIVTSGGMKYTVASRDHASIDPSGKRIAIWFDNGSGVMVTALHITAIEQREASFPIV